MTPTSTAVDRRIPAQIWILIAAAFAVAIGFGLIAPVLPQFASEFSVSVTATTVVVSAFATFRLLWAAPAGRLVEKFSPAPIYVTGVLIVAASSAATAYAQSYWQLLIFRSVGGIGSVMFTVAALALLIKLSPPAIRGKVSATYGATFLIGNIAGPVVGGLLASYGIRVPFLVYAGTLVLAAAVIGFFLPKGTHGPAATNNLPPLSLGEGLKDKAFQAALATGFANGWANFGVRISIVPLFVAAMISEDTRAAGFVIAAFAVGNAAVLPFTSRYADSRGRRPLIIGGALLCGGFTVAMGATTSLAVLLIVSAIAGGGVGAFNPAQQASVADVIGNERSGGTVLAAFQMVQDVGAIIGPILAGMIADRWGYSWAFALTGILLILTALPWLRADETLHRHSVNVK